MMVPFHRTLATLIPDGDRWTGEATADWMQGRSLFGGLQVAFALKAMRALVPAGLPLRVLQVTFLAPVPGGTVLVTSRVLRAGKNTHHVEGLLVAGLETLAVVIGIFGAPRQSAISLSPSQAVVAPGVGPAIRHIPGVTPDFLQHFTMRWLRGGLPYSGASDPAGIIEVTLHDEGTANELHVPAIADSIPPLALSMLRQPVAGSSMTWMLEFLQESYAGLPLHGWRLDAEVPAAANGYTSQTALLWTPDGRPAALSRQSMVVFG